ncbi:hypothetical protein Hypma_014831 [Hypsizygus marmoreus]|uniref:DUF6534 domain-containing protein n=1 Tax=Hypsizygus marmoreus TaxID=39966 RepID=A0A369K679_HYPMA|nr:hypothetical protein Hypma_014831 [Hypsizygus marmoreus]
MVFLLTREAPHFKRSKRLVHRLLIITVSSGSLTAVVATVALILVAVDSDTFYWATLDFPLCSVYLSTLLANLNTREYIKGNYDVNTTHDIEASNIPAAPGTTMLALKRFLDRDHEKNALPVPDRVYIHVQSHTERDSVDTVTPSL